MSVARTTTKGKRCKELFNSIIKNKVIKYIITIEQNDIIIKDTSNNLIRQILLLFAIY